jgi:hypothetical protein
MILAPGVSELLASKSEKKYRIVLDGNGDHRLQYKFVGMAQAGPDTWYFDPRTFPTSEDAERAVKECYVERVIKEL